MTRWVKDLIGWRQNEFPTLFIINFPSQKRELYQRVINRTKTPLMILDEARDRWFNPVPGYIALWLKESKTDLTDFWNEINKEQSKEEE